MRSPNKRPNDEGGIRFRDFGYDKILRVSLTPGFSRVTQVVQQTTSGFNHFSGAH
jgi:hypothetical protein